MDFKTLHEELKEAAKFLYESNEYKLTIITGRDRDSDGELTKESFKAKNDLEALLYVFKTYDLQNAGMFNGTYEDGDWDEEDEQLRQNILSCVKENKIEEGIKLLTDLYFDGFDISDYYDDIVKLEAPDGHVVFEDTNLDIEGWFEDEGQDFPDGGKVTKETPEEIEKRNKQYQVVLQQKEIMENLEKELANTDTPIKLDDILTHIEGPSTFIGIPNHWYKSAKLEANPTVDMNKAFSIEIWGTEENHPEKDKKVLNNVSIEQVKQFIIDNYKQIETRILNLDK